MKGAGRRSEQDRAFVLRTTDFGEADCIVVLLCDEHGKLEAFAKGARRMRSRWGSSLQPLSRIHARWLPRPARDLQRLLEAELLRSAWSVLSRPEGLVSFARIARMIETVSLAGSASPRLSRLLEALLQAAADAEGEPQALARLERYAELWVCRLEGFWPELERCSRCGQPLAGVRRVSAATDGAWCLGCHSPGTRSLLLGAEACRLAAAISKSPPAALLGGKLGRRAWDELGRFTGELLTFHLEKEFRQPELAQG